MIKNLVFDFGKVLVDYDFEAFFRHHIPQPERCRAFAPVLSVSYTHLTLPTICSV